MICGSVGCGVGAAINVINRPKKKTTSDEISIIFLLPSTRHTILKNA